MELVMKYKAKDGVTFDSVNECRAHEVALVKDSYVMLNRDGNKTEDPDEAMGVYIPDEESAKALLKRFRSGLMRWKRRIEDGLMWVLPAPVL